ncbi:putative DNA repair protein Rad9 [Trypanosoma cruzi]|uniref:Putative DNA repair protein Rad9 n=1 Tax=Trypanosoma cruzi TaxID=5693 RepID=A0A2V2W0A0_TRYCR|nr:putative DNA repair protein Rad9 [Trypanosoma cruzi]
MFLSFSVTGASVRPFMHLLQTVAKQGEGLFFEPHRDSLQLRVVNSTRSTHMLVGIAARYLEGYRSIHGNSVTNSCEKSGGATSETNLPRHEDDRDEFFLMLPTKALLATVLRQSQGLCSVHVRYNATSASDMVSCDTLQWECVMSGGIIKKFLLPLAEGRPERAFFSPDRFSFDACAAAWVWGALLGWFPASRPRVVVQPLESRLELWVVDSDEPNVMQGAHPPLESGKGGGAETKVVASQEHFLFMRQHEPRGEGTAVSNETSEVGDARAAPRSRGLSLPGKIVEVKPFKQVCLLADQLGMMIRVRTGVEGLPVFVEAITVQDAQQAAAAVAAATVKDAVAAESSNAAVQQNVFGRHSLPSENSFRVTFSMYIAAFDVPQRALDSGEGFTASSRRSTNSATTVTGEERGVVTASSLQEVNAPLVSASAAPPSSDGVPLSGIAQRTPFKIAENMATGQVIRPTGVTNEKNPVLNSVCSPQRVLVPASPTQVPSCALDGPSLVGATPLRSGGRISSPSNGEEMVVRATPEVGGIVTPHRGDKRPRGGESVDGRFPQESVVGCTAGTTDTTAMSFAPTASFVAPTNLSPNDRRQAGEQQGREGPIPSVSARPSLETRFPLDFNAFMQEIAEEAKEDPEESEEDEDLQRFLESCVSLLVLPVTPATQPK